jgi:tetratricopeptide (TPR) repeat protein
MLGGADMEKKMRLFTSSILAAVALGIAVPAFAAAPASADDQILPKSVELMHQGQSLLAAGKYEDAESAIEAALAVDPRNRWAFTEAAKVAIKQQLYGKAIRLTGKALAMEGNDPDALAVQGQAMVELGAIARAQENLAKLKTVCAQGCPQLAKLQADIGRGPTMAANVSKATDAKPTSKKN